LSIDIRDIQLTVAKKIGDIDRDKLHVDLLLKFEAGRLVHFQETKKGTPQDLIAEMGRTGT
jgi:hypothetical protein